MKGITYIENMHQLGLAKEAGMAEVILAVSELARFGKLSKEELFTLAKEAKNLEIKTCLEWDVLNTQVDFEKSIEFFNELDLTYIDVIRVQDPGVLQYVLEETNFPIQLILENGNHNFLGIKTWCDYVGDRLDRVVLSIELTSQKLQEYIAKLDVAVEFLCLGRILLFYSPRKLLSAMGKEKWIKNTETDFLEALGESEESPHKGFPIVENAHGTFMFHIKDFFLLEHIWQLKEMGLAFARFDLRFDKDFALIATIGKSLKENLDKDAVRLFKESYPADVIRGYFQVNKTDVLFKKLKNYRVQRKDENFVGEVLDFVKDKYLIIKIKTDLNLINGQDIKFITPEGKELTRKINKLKNTKLEDQERLRRDDLALVDYFSGVWPKSLVYLHSEE